MEFQKVSLTTAKLLRKRRFNEPVMYYYAPDGTLTASPDGIAHSWNSPTSKPRVSPPMAAGKETLRRAG